MNVFNLLDMSPTDFSEEEVMAYINEGFLIDFPIAPNGNSLLHEFVDMEDIIQLLLCGKCTNWNVKNNMKENALFAAVTSGNFETFKLLADHPDIEILTSNISSKTILDIASEYANINVLNYLKKLDIFNSLLKMSKTNLLDLTLNFYNHKVKRNYNDKTLDFIEVLIEDLKLKPSLKNLHQAYLMNDIRTIDYLINTEKNIFFGKSNKNIFHLISECFLVPCESSVYKNKLAWNFLVDNYGDHINDLDRFGNTPLHYIVNLKHNIDVNKDKRFECFSILMNSGSDPYKNNVENKSCMDIVYLQQNSDMHSKYEREILLQKSKSNKIKSQFKL